MSIWFHQESYKYLQAFFQLVSAEYFHGKEVLLHGSLCFEEMQSAKKVMCLDTISNLLHQQSILYTSWKLLC